MTARDPRPDGMTWDLTEEEKRRLAAELPKHVRREPTGMGAPITFETACAHLSALARAHEDGTRRPLGRIFDNSLPEKRGLPG